MSNKLIIAIIIIIALGGLGYFVYQFMLTPESTSLNVGNESQNNSNNPTSTEENNSGEPYIKIISPNGADSWKIGETYDIAWQSSGVKSLDIILENWDQMDGTWPSSILIARDISASLEKYSFILSENKLPPDAEKSGSHFKLRIVSYPLDYTISDRSDDFFTVQ